MRGAIKRYMMQRAGVVLMMLLAGCAVDEPEEPGCPVGFVEADDGCAFDEQAVGEAVAEFEHEGFTRANAEPFMQQFGPMKSRNVWVSDTEIDIGYSVIDMAQAVYRRIDPADPDATVSAELPAGTMLLHVGDAPPFGVMLKRENSYNPHDNNWWFGRFWQDGTPAPIETYNGQRCMDCHVKDGRQSRTDLLWGVPRSSLP